MKNMLKIALFTLLLSGSQDFIIAMEVRDFNAEHEAAEREVAAERKAAEERAAQENIARIATTERLADNANAAIDTTTANNDSISSHKTITSSVDFDVNNDIDLKKQNSSGKESPTTVTSDVFENSQVATEPKIDLNSSEGKQKHLENMAESFKSFHEIKPEDILHESFDAQDMKYSIILKNNHGIQLSFDPSTGNISELVEHKEDGTITSVKYDATTEKPIEIKVLDEWLNTISHKHYNAVTGEEIISSPILDTTTTPVVEQVETSELAGIQSAAMNVTQPTAPVATLVTQNAVITTAPVAIEQATSTINNSTNSVNSSVTSEHTAASDVFGKTEANMMSEDYINTPTGRHEFIEKGTDEFKSHYKIKPGDILDEHIDTQDMTYSILLKDRSGYKIDFDPASGKIIEFSTTKPDQTSITEFYDKNGNLTEVKEFDAWFNITSHKVYNPSTGNEIIG